VREQHVYGSKELAKLSWHETAAVAFGFFQMAGFNRYEDHVGGSGVVPFTAILTSLDDGKRACPHSLHNAYSCFFSPRLAH